MEMNIQKVFPEGQRQVLNNQRQSQAIGTGLTEEK